MKPTLYVTNVASRDLYGPGRSLHIMVWQAKWASFFGCVQGLRPHERDLIAYKNRAISLRSYKLLYKKWVAPVDLSPCALGITSTTAPPTSLGPVQDGDTLLCSCSRSTAARGECHRVWAAELLKEAGWDVILDGRELK